MGWIRVISWPYAAVTIGDDVRTTGPMHRSRALTAGTYQVRLVRKDGAETTFPIEVKAGRSLVYQWSFEDSGLTVQEERP